MGKLSSPPIIKHMILFKSKLVVISVIIGLLAISCLYWLKIRKTTAAIQPCVSNLLIIQGCKLDWANRYGKTPNDVPSWDDLKPQLASYAVQYKWTNIVPVCPDGGTYIIGRVGEPPTCSIGGSRHSLPQ